MGYDAYVSCNCYREGKTTEPPHKKHLSVETEGLFINLPEKTWYYKLFPNKLYQHYNEFDEWKRTACPHEDMEFASERIANITGMANFRYVVKKLSGKKNLNTLLAQLPEANGGFLPVELAQDFLHDLRRFEESGEQEEIISLTERVSGTVLWQSDGPFILDGRYKLYFGLDNNGFYIADKQNVLFRAWNFRQVTNKDTFTFINNYTGYEFISPRRIYPPEDTGELQKYYDFQCERFSVNVAEEYKYIIDSLIKLCQAALETGNPVIWC
ncbi:MAG TPA: hypothetical protein VEC12_01065 [Bacteroidia bacterium]|nr:hypothetical protein [Bacteroidia bacterium]